MKKLFLFLLLIIYSAGCTVKVPPLPSIQHDEIKNVGIINKVSNVPKHTHIGTTVFNNFEKELESNWYIHEKINQGLSECLKNKYDLNVIFLDNQEFTKEELNLVIVVKDDRWVFNEEKKDVLDKLRNEFNLDVLIGIEEGEFEVDPPHMAKGYGLFTRSFLTFDSFYAYYYIIPYILYLDKPGRAGGLKYTEGVRFSEYVGKFKMSVDIKKIEESEIDEVKERTLKFVDMMIGATCDAVFKIEEE